MKRHDIELAKMMLKTNDEMNRLIKENEKLKKDNFILSEQLKRREIK